MNITEELIEQTYQFCYRRLSNPDDARDLAQDILCEALQAISSKREIRDFQSWYWKMARNRYAVVINRRNKKPTEYLVDDYAESLFDETNDLVDNIVMQEELSRMHAMIARMAKIHREILVEYYIREKPIKKIAKKLDIPEGTVKRRLFDAKREIRKEMTRMSGATKLSYAPDELEIWASQAWDNVEVFQDLLAKQILASCYRKGRSITELSEQIQVASIYLEDKMNALLRIGLLKRARKNRYLTNFIILSKNVVSAMLDDLEDVYNAMCETVYNTIMEHWEDIVEIGFYGTHLPQKYLNTTFLPMLMAWMGACCVDEYQKHTLSQKFRSAENDSFSYSSDRIMGLVLPADEQVLVDEAKATKWRSKGKGIETVDGHTYEVFDNFCVELFRVDRIDEIHGNNVELLYELSVNPQKELSAQEEVSVGVLIKQGYIKKREGNYYPEIVVFEEEKQAKIRRHLKQLFMPKAREYKDELVKIINAHLFPYIREDLVEQYYNYVIEVFMVPSSYMVCWGYEKQLFVKPENPDTCAAGIQLIKK